MDTIFIISIIFVVIYNTWYDSYITHLFLLASEDTEKNSQRLKMIWSEREIDWWKPSKASIFTVNRQKLKSISIIKQFKEHLYLSRLLTTVLETLEWETGLTKKCSVYLYFHWFSPLTGSLNKYIFFLKSVTLRKKRYVTL